MHKDKINLSFDTKNNSNCDHQIGGAGSGLDNIGTFRHFTDNTSCDHHHKKDFYNLYYRKRNLVLKSKLEGSTKADHKIIEKCCKNLACCSSLSEVTEYDDSSVHITRTSDKCKNKYCLICSRIESNKNTIKFIEKATAPEHIDFFKQRHFYLLTLTVQHDEKNRTDNYLSDFRGYLNKLLRTKLYRDTFIQSSDKNNYGAIQSIEMTISKTNYHIHAHVLICSFPLKSKVADLQKKLSDQWLHITKDSTGVRLDLIKHLQQSDISSDDKDQNSLIKAVKEVFKYVVKCESLSTINTDQVEMLANWIIETKGKNFINALGYFRKLGIVRRVKKSDTAEFSPKDQDKNQVLLTKTININSNSNLNANYSKEQRDSVIKRFKITDIKGYFADVTNIQDDIRSIFNEFKNEDIRDVDLFLMNEMQRIKKNNDAWDLLQSENYFEYHFNKKAAENMNSIYPGLDCPF